MNNTTELKTISFIGSDKNAGKTTVFNFVRRRQRETSGQAGRCCVSAIGINGEDVDTYEHRPKPRIALARGDHFVTAAERLSALTGGYEILEVLTGSAFRKNYVVGRCVLDFSLVLEGPNSREEVLLMKDRISRRLAGGCLMLDGSIDRQFLAHPLISDEIYFSLLISRRTPQRQKARDLLSALTIPVYDGPLKEFLAGRLHLHTKSLLLDETQTVVYQGMTIPFLDEALKMICLKQIDQKRFLYLNGALSPSLFAWLAPLKKLTVILDNFTLYQQISVAPHRERPFRPELTLFHPALVKRIFLKQESDRLPPLPKNIPIHNLFRENPDEIIL